MNKWKTLLTVAMVSAIGLCSLDAQAREKKNDPDKKEVLKELKEIGGEHYVDKMKVSHVCSLKFEKPDGEDSYYHVYNADLKDDSYRVVVYDNTPTYLGYYPTSHEAYDYEEGVVFLDSGESDEDGNDDPFRLPIPSKGPAMKIQIDGVPITFVKNPKLAAAADGTASGPAKLVVPKEKSATGVEIDYRDWKITIQGKERIYNAIFVAKEGKDKIKIKDSKRGKIATVPVKVLSDADKEYLKSIGQL